MYDLNPSGSIEDALGLNNSLKLFDDDDSSNDEEQVTGPDKEIANLQRQIDDTESAIQSIVLSREEKAARYKVELEDIQNQIAEAEAFAEEQLAKQQMEFEEEVSRTRKDYEEELKNFQATMARSLAENSMWANYRNELVNLGDQAKIADLERRMEAEKAIYQENAKIAAIKEAQKKMVKKSEVIDNERKIHELEEEVASLQTKRREISQEIRLKIGELADKIETKERDHEMLIQKMMNELNQREKHFTEHTQSVKQMVDREKITANSDYEVANNKIESLKKILQSVNKRGSIQLQSLTRDIEKLKRNVEETRKGEENFATKSKEQMMKLQSLQKEVHYHRETFQHMQNELNRYLGINQYATNELNKYYAATKRASSSTTTTTGFRSAIFHH